MSDDEIKAEMVRMTVEEIAALEAQAYQIGRRSELAECINVLCPLCAAGVQPIRDGRGWIHFYMEAVTVEPYDPDLPATRPSEFKPCPAAALHNRKEQKQL